MRPLQRGMADEVGPPAQPAARAGWQLLSLLLLASGFIVYASLYPFRFDSLPEGTGIWSAPARAWAQPHAGRGDILANLLLYIPFSLLATLLLPRQSPVLRVLLVLLAGTTLSVSLELAQLFIDGRVSSGWDVLCNVIGTLVGAVSGLASVARTLDRRARVLEPVAALLVLAWLGARFYPYLPSLDLQAWRDNLKPLLLHPEADWERSLRLLASWTAAMLLTEAAFGRRLAVRLVPLIVLAALVAEAVVPGKRLELAEAVAVALTLPAWLALRGQGAWLAPAMVVAMLGVMLAEHLVPFTFQFGGPARDFGWIPFRSLIHGSLEASAQTILSKLFVQGTLLWWLVRSGVALPVAATLQAGVVLAASMLQTRIPSRSAEVTDAVLVAGLAALFHVMRVMPAARPARLA